MKRHSWALQVSSINIRPRFLSGPVTRMCWTQGCCRRCQRSLMPDELCLDYHRVQPQALVEAFMFWWVSSFLPRRLMFGESADPLPVECLCSYLCRFARQFSLLLVPCFEAVDSICLSPLTLVLIEEPLIFQHSSASFNPWAHFSDSF